MSFSGNFIFLTFCGGFSWAVTFYFSNRGFRALRNIFDRMTLSRPFDQQRRYLELPPFQRFQLVKAYHEAFGDDELWREWIADRDWAIVFFLLGGCFMAAGIA